jgi:hypothetical protein
MHTIFADYQALVTSPAQLALCRDVTSVPQLLALLKQLWQRPDLSDEQMLVQLRESNQQPVELAGDVLAQSWIPYSYHARTRTVLWCLPDGHATEPFHDQFISRCRQRILLNQLIVPRIRLPFGDLEQTEFTPAGFVFHLSRCGSTLVSGSFAEIEQVSVLSESQLLTEFLLDATLSETEKLQCLPSFIRWQGEGGKAPDQTSGLQVLIKWNAWDIFSWRLIRKLYPLIPVVLLIRNPEEILASHHRNSGRHMSGDPTLVSVHPVFGETKSLLLDFRIGVLGALQKAMLDVSTEGGVMVMDYRQLNIAGIKRIGKPFGIAVKTEALNRIAQRMQRHSKEPERQFTPDSLKKQQVFNSFEQDRIHELSPTTQALLALSLAKA